MADAKSKAKKTRALANFLDGVVSSKEDGALKSFLVDGEVAEPRVASASGETEAEVPVDAPPSTASPSAGPLAAEDATRGGDHGEQDQDNAVDGGSKHGAATAESDEDSDSDVEITNEAAAEPEQEGSSRWKEFMRGTTAPPSSTAVAAAAAAANAPEPTTTTTDTAAASAVAAAEPQSKENAAELLKKVHAELYKIGAKPLAEYVAIPRPMVEQVHSSAGTDAGDGASDATSGGGANASRKRPASTDPEGDSQPQQTRKSKGNGNSNSNGGGDGVGPLTAVAGTPPVAASTTASLPTFMDPLGMLVTAPSWTLRRRLAMSKTGRLRDIVKISEHKSYVSQLNELAQALSTKLPLYEAESRSGFRCSPDHFVTLSWEDHVFRDPEGQTSIKAGREKMARSALMYFAKPPVEGGEEAAGRE